MTSATYQVTAMTCEHCVRAVTAELSRLGGVTVSLVPGGSGPEGGERRRSMRPRPFGGNFSRTNPGAPIGARKG